MRLYQSHLLLPMGSYVTNRIYLFSFDFLRCRDGTVKQSNLGNFAPFLWERTPGPHFLDQKIHSGTQAPYRVFGIQDESFVFVRSDVVALCRFENAFGGGLGRLRHPPPTLFPSVPELCHFRLIRPTAICADLLYRKQNK